MTEKDKQTNQVSGMFCSGKVVGLWEKKDLEKIIDNYHKAGNKGNPPSISMKMVGHNKRAGCGCDVSELINKLPFDGVEYKIRCPACKNPISVRRTPLDDGNDSEQAEAG